MSKTLISLILSVLLATLASCARDAHETSDTFQPGDATPPTLTLNSGVVTDNMDNKVRPQDDFFNFVNGGWVERTEIPADRSSFGAFVTLRENAEKSVRDIATVVMRPVVLGLPVPLAAFRVSLQSS